MANTSTATDPWLESTTTNPEHTFDVPLDTRKGPQHIAADLTDDTPAEQLPATPPNQPADDDQPEVIEIEGGTVTIKHDAKGWTGVLSLDDGGGDEVFRGKTQKELMANVLAGKAKATAQIRKLNRKLKLGTPVEEPVVVTEPTAVEPKQLTANDIFEIKTALDADPDKAFDLWFQKKFNLSAADLVNIARSADARSRKGEEAYEELSIEGVSKEFLENHKDEYYPWAENGEAIMAWLCKNKLRRVMRKSDDFTTLSSELLRKGLYTVDNLEEAFEDLKDSGLLIPPPRKEVETEVEEVEENEPVVVPATTTPAASNPRIVSTRRQPRGGLGIRSGSVTTRQPEEPRAPSADELENMSQSEFNELYNQTMRLARSTRR